MLKRFLCILSGCIFFISSFGVYASQNDVVFVDYKFYTATIYLCDPESNEIILRNVKPENRYRDGISGARSLEYITVPMNPDCMYSKKGEVLSCDTVNEFLLDSNVTVLVGKNSKGRQKVLYVGF